MKTSNYFIDKTSPELVNEHNFEIMNITELYKIRGGISDPDLK